MLDHSLESAFVAFLQNDPAFAGIQFFTGHDDEEHQLPSVTFSSKSEPLAGSATVFRSDVTVLIESEAHDNTPNQHAALVEKVRAHLANKSDFVAGINTANLIHLYGYAFTASNLDVDGARFRTTLAFRAGYGVP